MNPCDYRTAHSVCRAIDLWLVLYILLTCIILISKLISVPLWLTKINHTVDWSWYCFGLIIGNVHGTMVHRSSALHVFDHFSCTRCRPAIRYLAMVHCIINLTKLDKPVFVGRTYVWNKFGYHYDNIRSHMTQIQYYEYIIITSLWHHIYVSNAHILT